MNSKEKEPVSHPFSFTIITQCRKVKWGEHGTYETLATLPQQHQLHLNPRSSFLIKEDWVEIYSNQKTINCISPSNLRASVETRPPKLPNLLQFSPPSILDILCPPPLHELREVLRYTYF